MDFHVITRNLLLFVLAPTVVAILTKAVGCGLPAKLQGINIRDSFIIGVGIMPREEVAMIAVFIGLNQKLILQDTYAASILMSLLTTIFPR